MTRVAIVIVTYNCRREIDACLQSLADAAPRVPHETLVVDNASTDGTAVRLHARWPAVRTIEAGGNLGFARANNLGIRASASELVLLLNPDTLVPPGAIDALVAVLDRRPDAAVAGPRLVDAAGRAELSFGPMPGPLAELRQKLLVTGHDRGLPVISTAVERLTRRARDVDWVSGACLLIRRADLEAAGLLDERYFLYLEDVDLCAAARGRGRAVVFDPSSEIVHLRGRSRATARTATQLAYRRSHLAFYEKHRPAWAPLLRRYLRWKGELPDDDPEA
jgi:GT2 family glycosyltransferase